MKRKEGVTAVRQRKALMVAGILCLLLTPAADSQKPEELTVHVHVTCVGKYNLHKSDGSTRLDETDQITIEYDATSHNTAPPGTPPWQMSSETTDYHFTVNGTGTGSADDISLSWTWKLVDAAKDFRGLVKEIGPGSFEVALPDFQSDAKIEPQVQLQSAGKSKNWLEANVKQMVVGMGIHPLADSAATFFDTPLSKQDYDAVGQFHEELKGTFDQNAKSFTKTGSASRTSTNPLGMTSSIKVEYSLSFNQQPEELEAILIPDQGYEDWMPEGSAAGEDSAGGLFRVDVKLRDKNDPKKQVTKNATFTFQLEGVSSEPGVNLNSPPEDQVKGTPDLAFEQKYNSGLDVTAAWQTQSGGAGDKATSKKKDIQSTAFISSFDYGGWGTLKVYADVEDGQHLTAHLEDQASVEELKLPKDDNNNHIADVWEKQFKLTSTAGDADDDATPTGDGTLGDGLSLYEEYRGFMVITAGKDLPQEKRTDPTRKTLFVDDQVGGVKGVELFAAASRLEVYEIEDEGMNLAHVVNFNHKTGHAVDQHGLWMTGWESSDWGGEAEIGPPKYVTHVHIAAVTPAVVAHELGHAVGMPHHGKGDYRCADRSGCTSVVRSPSWNQSVAVQGGQTSGGENCLMRYEQEDLIERSSNGKLKYVRYYEPDEKSAAPQSRFCRSDTGTGVNAAGYTPGGSKAGDATKDCGKSQSYIRISDRYDTQKGTLTIKGCLGQ